MPRHRRRSWTVWVALLLTACDAVPQPVAPQRTPAAPDCGRRSHPTATPRTGRPTPAGSLFAPAANYFLRSGEDISHAGYMLFTAKGRWQVTVTL